MRPQGMYLQDIEIGKTYLTNVGLGSEVVRVTAKGVGRVLAVYHYVTDDNITSYPVPPHFHQDRSEFSLGPDQFVEEVES